MDNSYLAQPKSLLKIFNKTLKTLANTGFLWYNSPVAFNAVHGLPSLKCNINIT